ncbi:MAG: hypothetical protein IJR51_10300 [Clostridia bacterium]|nr:hypothetical protein [Clostridia bacterium]MBQ9507535.1 hypothetical protein [Clostridia bacterium]MBR5422981.1 hypothetical protein [Clostridia bacterium]
MKRDRNYYLNRSAELMSRRVYAMVRDATRPGAPEKGLKDLCALLKETVGISAALEKQNELSSQTVRVVFEDVPEEFAE